MFGITNYKVRYTSQDGRSNTMDANGVNEVVIENLDAGGKYTVEVAAINDAGMGVFSPHVSYTLQASDGNQGKII